MGGGQDHVNVFHWQTAFAASQTDEDVTDAILAKLDTAYAEIETRITGAQSTYDVKIDEVEFVVGEETIIRNLGTFAWADVSYSPSAAGEGLPPGIACLVKFLTNVGKTYGRKFIGGLTEPDQAGGQLGATALSDFVDFAVAILVDIVVSAGNDLIAGTMSKRSASFKAFTGYDVSNNLAYQRRRRKGTGS